MAEAVRDLRARRRTAAVRGGGTLFDVADGGPPDLVLDTRALDAVPYYEPADLIVTCGAGVTLERLQEALAARGQVLPVWHPRPDVATVGGLAAFGWTGIGRQLYGRLRDRVLEVRAVTGEGKVVRGGARVVKNVTGFDLPRLFFGSMGTLGVLVELSLKVHPRPAQLFASTVDPFRIPADTVQPVEVLAERVAGRWRGWRFAPGPESDAAALLGGDVEPGDQAFERIAASALLAPADQTRIVCRGAVPPSGIGAFIERIGGGDAVVDVASGVAWFEAQDAETARRDAEAAGGSLVLLSAPPDIRAAIGTWGTAPAGVELMRRLKDQFDPDGVLAPGRFVV